MWFRDAAVPLDLPATQVEAPPVIMQLYLHNWAGDDSEQGVAEGWRKVPMVHARW